MPSASAPRKTWDSTPPPTILCAADYGVPQTRYRAIIVGGRESTRSCFFPPMRTHEAPLEPSPLFNGKAADGQMMPRSWRTVRDVIADLRPPRRPRSAKPSPLDLHFHRNPTPRSLSATRPCRTAGTASTCRAEITPGCWIRKTSGGTDLFGRLWWDRPSVTMRTEFYKPEKGRYLHPEQHRPITHREAARMQTFPDEFHFEGTKTEIAKQIGNAVPPVLAARLADVVLAMLLAGIVVASASRVARESTRSGARGRRRTHPRNRPMSSLSGSRDSADRRAQCQRHDCMSSAGDTPDKVDAVCTPPPRSRRWRTTDHERVPALASWAASSQRGSSTFGRRPSASPK